MNGPIVQARFLHAASFASLQFQVSEHLFPEKRFFELSPDQRRILQNETQVLLLQARWAVENKGFAEQFAIPQAGVDMAPPRTILGEPLAKPGGSSGSYI